MVVENISGALPMLKTLMSTGSVVVPVSTMPKLSAALASIRTFGVETVLVTGPSGVPVVLMVVTL